MKGRLVIPVLCCVAVSGGLFVLTLSWPDWIERSLPVDLDARSGAIEKVIVLLFAALTCLLSVNAWRGIVARRIRRGVSVDPRTRKSKA